jgi:limonene 1,2-monooxygenase
MPRPTLSQPLRFGLFIPPIQSPGESPTLLLERNLELIQHCDRLGYHEAWIGEHHSGGWEIIAAPELFIATAAERTRHIRLGTGVNSLAYHQPLVLADRLVLLDHLTRGRIMMGIGPGSLASDAIAMGIEPGETRRMAEEGLEAIMALLAYDGPVTRETDWFTLRNAQLHLRPYQHPRFPISVAAAISPSGPRLAGRFGLGMLSVGAASPAGMAVLANLWSVAEEMAAENGKTVSRDEWAVCGALYIADSMDDARRELRHGLMEWREYMGSLSGMPMDLSITDVDEAIDEMNESKFALIGTPQMAIDHIEWLLEQSGGFGSFLLTIGDWGGREGQLRSTEQIARKVIPHFSGQLARPRDSWAEMKAGAAELKQTIINAQLLAAERHAAERAAGGKG